MEYSTSLRFWDSLPPEIRVHIMKFLEGLFSVNPILHEQERSYSALRLYLKSFLYVLPLFCMTAKKYSCDETLWRVLCSTQELCIKRGIVPPANKSWRWLYRLLTVPFVSGRGQTLGLATDAKGTYYGEWN